MKKNAIYILLIVAINVYVSAQDTVTHGYDHYLFRDNPVLCMRYDIGEYYGIGGVLFNRFRIPDSTKIYGIAACLNVNDGSVNGLAQAVLFQTCDTGVIFLDTTSQISTYNYFVYEHRYKVENGVISQLDTTFKLITPIYEFYFDSGITVSDTFYVGLRHIRVGHIYCVFSRAIISEEWDTNAYCRKWNPGTDFYQYTNNYEWIGHYWSTAYWGGIFPIIKPLNDTADSTGVRQVVSAGSVRVEPNPAHGSVSVRAAEGLRRVEFFDMTGLRALSREASGTATSIDIATLPAGVYIVRVHTTKGIVSRKLVIM